MLHTNVSCKSTPEMKNILQSRIVCLTDDNVSMNEANLTLRFIGMNIANTLAIQPIKSIPIISTALAKNLSSSFSHFRDGLKTGFVYLQKCFKTLFMFYVMYCLLND